MTGYIRQHRRGSVLDPFTFRNTIGAGYGAGYVLRPEHRELRRPSTVGFPYPKASEPIRYRPRDPFRLFKAVVQMFAPLRPERRPEKKKERSRFEIDASLELLEGLSRKDIKRIRRLFTITEVDADTRVARQGYGCSEFVLVVDGQVGVSVDEGPVVVFGSGCWFGATALLDRTHVPTWKASFDALEPTTVAVATSREFAAIMHDFPVVAERIRTMAAIRQAFLDRHYEQVAEGLAQAAIEEFEKYPVRLMAGR